MRVVYRDPALTEQVVALCFEGNVSRGGDPVARWRSYLPGSSRRQCLAWLPREGSGCVYVCGIGDC